MEQKKYSIKKITDTDSLVWLQIYDGLNAIPELMVLVGDDIDKDEERLMNKLRSYLKKESIEHYKEINI